MFALTLAKIALLLYPPLFWGTPLRENEVIFAGGSCEADGLWVCGPSFFLRRGSPGVVVGMVQEPGKKPGHGYVMIIKGDNQRNHFPRVERACEAGGSAAVSKGSLEIADQKVDFAYRIVLDLKGKPRETFSINGKPLDLAQGRVVLVDLSGLAVNWKQVGVDLAPSPICPTRTEQVEAQARRLLRHLAERKKEVIDFSK